MTHKFPENGVLAITPPDFSGVGLAVQLEEVLRGGAAAVLYAPTYLDGLGDAEVLQGLTASYKVPYLVTEVSVAEALGADGVHIYEEDTLTPKDARAQLGSDAIVGYSVPEDPSKLDASMIDISDYILVGSYPIESGESYDKSHLIELVKKSKKSGARCIVVRGVTAKDDIQQLIAAGAGLIALPYNDFLSADVRNLTSTLVHACNSVKAA